MADVGNYRWVEKFAQNQGPMSQHDMIWLTDKLKLPTVMHARWRVDEHTAPSAGLLHPQHSGIAAILSGPKHGEPEFAKKLLLQVMPVLT